MSYKTNPILNRIKINKGWKNPYLPTKTLNYSRDISLWFKVYLFLKIFLNLKKIQLISFEVRSDQQNKKILYLLINQKGTQKKKRKKKKTALKKSLHRIQTPISKNSNEGAIFFLYKNLVCLKNLSFWNQNAVFKKVLSKFWITKPKTSSWLNTLEKILCIRKNSRKSLNYLKKNQNFIPTQHLKLKFYTSKQKQVLTKIVQIKKIERILFVKLFRLSQQENSEVLQKIIENLKKKINTQQIQIQQLNAFYKFLLLSTQNLDFKKKYKKFSKTLVIGPIQRQQLNFIWKLLKKKMNSFGRARFLKKELIPFLLNINQNFFRGIATYNWNFLKKETVLKNILHLNFLVTQISKNNFCFKNYFLFSKWHSKLQGNVNTYKNWGDINSSFKNLKTKSFLKFKFCQITKSNKIKQSPYINNFYNNYIWLLLRKKKLKKRKRFRSKKVRKKLKVFRKKFKAKFKKNSFQKYSTFWAKNKVRRTSYKNKIGTPLVKINQNLKKNHIANYYKYRLPYRQMHFNFMQVMTNLRLKYLIQDFVQKYFYLQVEAKIVHVLNAYKNKNYFRLVFPVRKKKNNQRIKKRRINLWSQKKLFLTSRLQIATSLNQGQKQNWKRNKITKKNVRILKKENLFILAEKKRLKKRVNTSFAKIKRGKDFRYIFKYIVPTLMNFSHSLDPQLLADVLAKVIHQAKKQTWMLSSIKYLLKLIQLPKTVGYKIVLSGRINSKTKRRVIYITQKQITLQIFKNKINFAYSQANTRIGAFGLKIWIYSNKKKKKNEKIHSVT